MKARLNKYLSMCGVASRRKADELIHGRKVRVNGAIVEELGRVIDVQSDKIQVGSRTITPETKRYIILNKPRLYITALGEGQSGKKTIQELIKGIPERVYPVGRLDFDTEGLLILTNNGEIANRILHPSYKLSKVYIALAKGRIDDAVLTDMNEGSLLEDGYARPDYARVLKYMNDDTSLEIAFHEGRNHIVKRFLAKFGHPALRLKRVAVGPLKLDKLERGRWRDISERELKLLKRACGLDF